MDSEKRKSILKKVIIFVKVILNLSMVLCCYLLYNSITKKDIRVIMFVIGMVTFNILAGLCLDTIKRWEIY